jgi:threonine aldolase
MNFTSDNASGIAPEIMAAIARANEGAAASYGDDEITKRLTHRFSEIFEHEVAVFPVVTGTAANALALAAFTPPHGAVFCHAHAHLNVDECGAPEMFTAGAKLLSVEGAMGKMTPQTLHDALGHLFPGLVHHIQAATLSLTQATEMGTVYRLDEIAELAAVAHERGLAVHMDGARLANAVVSLGRPPAEITWKAGVDVLSFGATKNGALAAEAVVFFDPARAADFIFRRKRSGHLVSKMRFLSAQLEAYLDDDLWLRLAAHANAMATRLAEGLRRIPGGKVHYPVEANEVFVRLPLTRLRKLWLNGASFHPWPVEGDSEEEQSARLVTSFATRVEDIDRLLALAGD